MNTKYLLFCLFGAMAFTQVTYAEVNFGKQTPSAQQVIDALQPETATESPANDDGFEKPNTRMIDLSNLEGKSATPAAKSAPVHTQAKVKTSKGKKAKSTEYAEKDNAQTTALSMEIVFDYNSANLTEAAKTQLNPVGEALASGKLQNLSFVIEGHTDAVGGQSYNQQLSEARAAAVKAFLTSTYHLNASSIQIVGKGKNDLLDPNNPTSEVNRRVRIVAKR